MKVNIVYITMLVVLLAEVVCGQEIKSRLAFNHAPIETFDRLVFLSDSSTVLGASGKEIIGYQSADLQQIFYVKQYDQSLISYVCPLKDFQIAYTQDTVVLVKDLSTGLNTDTIQIDYHSYKMDFDPDNDELIIAVTRQRWKKEQIIRYSLKRKQVSGFIPLKPNCRIREAQKIPGTKYFLIQYSLGTQDYVAFVDTAGDILHELDVTDRRCRLDNSRRSLLVYGSSDYSVYSIANLDFRLTSGTADQSSRKSLDFSISVVHDINTLGQVLLCTIDTLNGKIRGKEIPPNRVVTRNGKQHTIRGKKWWRNKLYLLDLNTSQIIDSIEVGTGGKGVFKPNSNSVFYSFSEYLGDLKDEIQVHTYDYRTHEHLQQSKKSNTEVSPIENFAYCANGNLLGLVTQDFQFRITNLNTSHYRTFRYNLKNDSLGTKHYSEYYDKNVMFSANGSCMFFWCRDFFSVYSLFDEQQVFTTDITYQNEIYQVYQTKNANEIVIDRSDALFKFYIRERKLVEIFDKSLVKDLIEIRAEMISDSLMVLVGDFKMNFTATEKKFVKDNKIKGFKNRITGIKLLNINTHRTLLDFIGSTQPIAYKDGEYHVLKSIYDADSTQKIEFEDLRYVWFDAKENKLYACSAWRNFQIDFTDNYRIESFDGDRSFFEGRLKNSNRFRRGDTFNETTPILDTKLGRRIDLDARMLASESDFEYGIVNPFGFQSNITILKNDSIVALVDEDGYLKMFDLNSGRNLLNIVIFKNAGWITYDQSGFFDLDCSMLPFLSWQEQGELLPFENLYNTFFQPTVISNTFLRENKNPLFDLEYFLRIPSLNSLIANHILTISRVGNSSFALFSEPNQYSRIKLRSNLIEAGLRITEPYGKYDFAVELPKSISFNPVTNNTRPKAIMSIKPSSRSNLYYVGIGIGEYPVSSGMPKLQGVRKSIENFYGIFHKYDKQFKNIFDSIYYWNPMIDSEATMVNIFNHLNNVITKVGKDDALVIYLAGHGTVPTNSEVFYFMPYDVNTSSVESTKWSSFNTSYFVDMLRFVKSNKVILLIDACNSGGSLESLNKIISSRLWGNILNGTDDKYSINLFASSLPYQSTFLPPEGSAIISSIDKSIEYLIRSKKQISVHSLFTTVSSMLRENARENLTPLFVETDFSFELLSDKK